MPKQAHLRILYRRSGRFALVLARTIAFLRAHNGQKKCLQDRKTLGEQLKTSLKARLKCAWLLKPTA